MPHASRRVHSQEQVSLTLASRTLRAMRNSPFTCEWRELVAMKGTEKTNDT